MQAQGTTRYLNQDGTINWEFLRRWWYRTPPDASEKEVEVLRTFHRNEAGRYPLVRRLLAEWGEYTITDQDLREERNATQAHEQFLNYLETRPRTPRVNNRTQRSIRRSKNR